MDINDPGHYHSHHNFEHTNADVAEPDSITEEESGVTEEELEDSEYYYDSHDEAEEFSEYVQHSYTDDQSLQGIVVSSLLSRSGASSYDEFMTMLKNGSLSSPLSREACDYNLGNHNKPHRPVADPNLVYH